MNVKGNIKFTIRKKTPNQPQPKPQPAKPFRAGDAHCGFARVAGGIPLLSCGWTRLAGTQKPAG